MIRNCLPLLRKISTNRLPWLILGKGPSFARRGEIDFRQYNVFAISDTANFVDAAVVHCMDAEAMARIEPVGSPRVVVPWRPHIGYKSTEVTLMNLIASDTDDWFKPLGVKVLNWFNTDRLYSFNSSTSRLPPNPDLSIVKVKVSTAVAAFSLLTSAGIALVYCLGVDGGELYSPEFDKAHLMANGRSFGDQFQAIKNLEKNRQARLIPLLRDKLCE